MQKEKFEGRGSSIRLDVNLILSGEGDGGEGEIRVSSGTITIDRHLVGFLRALEELGGKGEQRRARREKRGKEKGEEKGREGCEIGGLTRKKRTVGHGAEPACFVRRVAFHSTAH